MKSWNLPSCRALPFLLLALAWPLLPACGTSSNLYITKPLDTPLDVESATVVTQGNGVKLGKYAPQLKKMLVRRLERKKLFDRVGPDGDVIIQAIIQNMDDGKEVGRGLSLKGKAEVTVEVKITRQNGTKLAHLTASAESPREDDEDRPDLRVLEAAADEIVRYLEEQAAGAAKAKAKAKPKAKPKAKAEVEVKAEAEPEAEAADADEAKAEAEAGD